MNALRALNRIPWPLTREHYFACAASDRGEIIAIDSAKDWDILRAKDPHFSVKEDRAEWLLACESIRKKDGQDGRLKQRAADIVHLFERYGITSVYSLGVGGAGLEYQIKKLAPEVNLVVSEFAPDNVRRLKNVFVEADGVECFDILHDSFGRMGGERHGSLCLIYRMDPSLTNEEWRNTFNRMKKEGVRRVLFIPSSLLTLRSLAQRTLQQFKWRIKQRPVVFAGYLRSKKAFQRFWRDMYQAEEIELGGLTGFLLTLK